jgi:hypothetical protein
MLSSLPLVCAEINVQDMDEDGNRKSGTGRTSVSRLLLQQLVSSASLLSGSDAEHPDDLKKKKDEEDPFQKISPWARYTLSTVLTILICGGLVATWCVVA